MADTTEWMFRIWVIGLILLFIIAIPVMIYMDKNKQEECSNLCKSHNGEMTKYNGGTQYKNAVCYCNEENIIQTYTM